MTKKELIKSYCEQIADLTSAKESRRDSNGLFIVLKNTHNAEIDERIAELRFKALPLRGSPKELAHVQYRLYEGRC